MPTTPDNIIAFPAAARALTAGRRLIPSRLQDGRRAVRLTQTELAERIGVTRQSVSAYERGDKSPESDTFAKICEALGQPPAFFTAEDAPDFGRYSVRFFRKVGPDTLRRNEACAVLTTWFAQTARYLDGFVNYPAVDIPQAAPADPSGRYSEDEIEAIAEDCRRQWGLGLGPISNVAALIESKGVALCRYEIEGERIDAFSFWNGDRPFVFMAAEKESGARVRFDLAHELGHLILHRWIEAEEIADPKTLKIIEREADRFAGAFLLPRRSFPSEVYSIRLDAFLELKRRWRVSVQAMIYRSSDLGVIDENQFTNLYKQLSFRKWRTKEPLDDPRQIAIEQPKLMRRAMELILDGGRVHPDEILADLALSPRIIERFCGLPDGSLAREGGEAPDLTLK
ncbi:hypothetical protein ASD21_05270 [Caulobacter sp. Root1455]|uniref:helix-turn-helix domain-containing protein n=1 Tax=Caulobacter sp. Root1455 TaxID=1736465 RepID=UPI000700F02D|nr:XRE family transcriptional regulator [Caulobacter sp. Root1455]KQY95921.1 hypothetical protein ASD21_05270 [Caulobacter sp. Root1455]